MQIFGIVRRLWQPVMRDVRCDLELFIEANNVIVNNAGKVTRALAACRCRMMSVPGDCVRNGRDAQ